MFVNHNCDDVMSEQTAWSKLERTTINDWVGVGLETRLLEGKSGQLVVNTRWHLDDISGYLEKRDKESKTPWRILRVPAIMDTDALKLYYEYNPQLDANKYVIGGSYWPEHKPIERLLQKKEGLPPHHWAAAYQQTPVAEEGSMFKEKYFEKWTSPTLPECKAIFVSFDTAFTESERKDAAKSAYTIWGLFDFMEVSQKTKREINATNMILLGCEAGYWSYPELLDKCFFLKNLYKDNLDFFLVEKRASGISLIQDLRQRGYPVVEFMPDKDKESRGWATVGILESGRIWINPQKNFTKDFMTEILGFPYGDLKDIVDTFTMATLFVRNSMDIIPQEYVTYADLYDDEDNNVVPFNRRPVTYWTAK